MRKQYDDFTQMKLKDMCKSISDMTFTYVDPKTNTPTFVPPAHYESILNQVTEKYMSDVTSRQFLSIMYTQLASLKKEDEKYFNQALVCLDLGLNPKDLRLPEQIAMEYINEHISNKKNYEKKNFHYLNEDIINAYEDAKNDPSLQVDIIKASNMIKDIENEEFNHKDYNERE